MTTTAATPTELVARGGELVGTLLAPESRHDPYPLLAEMRELAPVLPTAWGDHLVTGYDACREVLNSPAFGMGDATWRDAHRPEWRRHPLLFHVFSTLVGLNPPDHTRLRTLVSRAFTARRIEALRGFVERQVHASLDDLAERGADGTPVDLQQVLSLPLPIAVIGELVGVPPWDREPFQQLVQDAASVVFEIAPEPAAMDRGNEAYLTMRGYFTGLVAERRRRPTDDLTSALVAARDDDGDRLTEDELLDLLVFLFAAGFETTMGLIGNGVVALAHHPDQFRLLRARPDLVPNAVEELGRFDGPLQMTRRVALRDTEITGMPFPAGSSAVGFVGAANRDPARYTDPDRLDVTRREARPLSYGGGIHYCLGAALARLEVETALRLLNERLPHLTLAGAPERAPGLAIRRFAAVPVAPRG